MANFAPLKNYILYCLDRLIDQYELEGPFLDIGCGIGDISSFVAMKGWRGKAIDISPEAVIEAQKKLEDTTAEVCVEQKSFFQEDGLYKTVLVMDVLEHIANDRIALKKISALVAPGGYAVFSIPSNPREWRWDDDFYGHYRRYTMKDIKEKLLEVQLEPLVFWDFTYPVFWIMRRLYTILKTSPPSLPANKTVRTKTSALNNSWNIPVLSSLLSRGSFIWKLVYITQFAHYKKKVERGHEMIILAKKDASAKTSLPSRY